MPREEDRRRKRHVKQVRGPRNSLTLFLYCTFPRAYGMLFHLSLPYFEHGGKEELGRCLHSSVKTCTEWIYIKIFETSKSLILDKY